MKFNKNHVKTTTIPEQNAQIYPLDDSSNKNKINVELQQPESTPTDNSIIYVEWDQPAQQTKLWLWKQIQTDLGPYWEQTNTNTNQASYAHAYLAMSTLMEPQTYKEACNLNDAAKWKQAMDEEYTSLIKNKTWDLIKTPKDQNIINIWWLYRIKQKADGSIDHYKAWLITKGYTQEYGVDYDETYSPVFKFTSLWTILSIGVTLDFEIYQMDIKTAFLNGNIDTKMYIQQPPGYEQKLDLVCKLQKGIYGLKQSPCLWNKWINEFLLNMGFQWCQTDQCIYYKPSDKIILGIYVDDIIIITPSIHLEHTK